MFSWKNFHYSIYDDQEFLLFIICHTYFNQISHIYRKHSHRYRFLVVLLFSYDWSFCCKRIAFSCKHFNHSIYMYSDQEILLLSIRNTYFNQILHIYRKHSHWDRFLVVTPVTNIIFLLVSLLYKDSIFSETILQFDF